jgi:N-acetylmuramoyl-L-alanine amidase
MQAKTHLPQGQELFEKILLFGEDRFFYRHHGILRSSILAARNYNKKYGKKIGGSTITQQLARSLYLSGEKSLCRKFKELWLTLFLELRYSKREILDLYMEHIYCGLPERGVYAAARGYFHKELADLSLQEMLMLVAILPSPDKNSPRTFPEDARKACEKMFFRLWSFGFVSTDAARRFICLHQDLTAEDAAEIIQALADGLAQSAAHLSPHLAPFALKLLPMTERKKTLMREYACLHYGTALTTIKPQAVVLHWTAGGTWQSIYNYFLPAENKQLQYGSLNVGSQFVVDRDGTIIQLADADYLCRHTRGYNWCAIGIENVGGVDGKEDLTPAQVEADVRLLQYLRLKYRDIRYVFGHYQQEEAKKFGLYKELVPGYTNHKIDPGPKFMQQVKDKLQGWDLEFL